MQGNPQPHDISLAALAPMGDALLGEINQLREQDPIYWSELSHCWIVTGHGSVMEGLAGTLPLANHAFPEVLYRVMPKEELERRLPSTVHYMGRISTNLDGAEHANLRRLLVKAVNRKLVEDLRPYVRDRVSMLLDQADQRGTVEFHEEIARMLPGAVILKLLGMPADYLPRLKHWADGITKAMTFLRPPAGLARRARDCRQRHAGHVPRADRTAAPHTGPGPDHAIDERSGGRLAPFEGRHPGYIDPGHRRRPRHDHQFAHARRQGIGAAPGGLALLARAS